MMKCINDEWYYWCSSVQWSVVRNSSGLFQQTIPNSHLRKQRKITMKSLIQRFLSSLAVNSYKEQLLLICLLIFNFATFPSNEPIIPSHIVYICCHFRDKMTAGARNSNRHKWHFRRTFWAVKDSRKPSRESSLLSHLNQGIYWAKARGNLAQSTLFDLTPVNRWLE